MNQKHKEPFRILYVITCLFCLATGMMVILYPCIASAWNSHTQSRAISGYNETVKHIENHRYEQMWLEAESFNQTVIRNGMSSLLSKEETEQYKSLLSEDPDGMIGYIEIPSIRCRLPVYHGTEEKTLSSGAGHVEWSSLPTGGENTHCVISGHSGMPGAELFNHLSEVRKGDVFTLYVLDRILSYEIIRIQTCLPEETDLLKIREGEDLCTLVTCTPYGINSHRLLITGKRIHEEPVVTATAESSTKDSLLWISLGTLLWMAGWMHTLLR